MTLSSKFKILTLALFILGSIFITGCAEVEVRATESKTIGPREIVVDASKVTGTIRSFQGVNCGPYPLMKRLVNVGRQYQDLGIDIVRTHDFFGPIDIDAKWSNPDRISKSVGASGLKAIFPNWDADPDKEESYNFGPSDRVIKAIIESGAEVYWRIGRSWSADPDPPADFDKFANIVKHVAMHYNNGWANGFHCNIRYWEFWNEPDLKESWFPGFAREFWAGTPQQFYYLYEKVARALKSFNPELKVGACGKAAPVMSGAYREDLIIYCAAHNVPLDFFSWHHYHDRSLDPYDMVRIGDQYRRMLDDVGFTQAETHVTEWNMNLTMANKGPHHQASMENAAFTGAALIYLQDSKVSRSFYYRGDGTVMGLFDFDGGYRKKAYTYKATGSMLAVPDRLSVTGGDTFGFAVLAGKSKGGDTVQVLMSNYEIPANFRNTRKSQGTDFKNRNNISYRNNTAYSLVVKNLPWGDAEFSVARYRLSKTQDFTLITESSQSGGRFRLEKPLPPPALELIVLKRK